MARIGHYTGMSDLTLGVCVWTLIQFAQSLGWEHYEVHEPEPHILLFKSVSVNRPLSHLTNRLLRRPLNYQPPLQQ
jgi:hypothetical protein